MHPRDVRVPHALAPEQLERLEAEEKALRNCSATVGGGTYGLACCGAINSIFDVADRDELHALCQ